MKIYYVANARMPTEKAHGIQLAKMCEALIKEGVDLELIVPNRSNNITDTLEQFYNLREGIPFRKLPVVDIFSWGRLGFVIASCTFMFSYFLYLRRKMKECPAIIYTTDLDQFSFLLIPFVGLPYFTEIHDAKEKTIPFTFLFRNACGIIVINQIIQERISSVFGIALENIFVHPNGVDFERFGMTNFIDSRNEAREKCHLPIKAEIVLYVGKFYRWKGLAILREAAQSLPWVLFYLVGGDPNEFLKIAGEARLPANLICVGHKDYKEIPAWLAAADALIVLGTVSNEYSYRHTSPMKLFEYMASRRPIIASSTPANKLIVSEKEAFFYTPDNHDDLAAQVSYVLSHKDEAEKKAWAAWERAMTFDWGLRANRFLTFINEKL